MKAFDWFLKYGVSFACSTIGEGHRGGESVVSLPLASLWQTHSSVAMHVGKPGIYEGDGLITSKKGLHLGIVSADCLPVLFFDPLQRKISLIHAGWKGLHNDFPLAVLKQYFAMNIPDLLIGIGPHICQAHYEVENPAQQKINAWHPFLKPSPKQGSFFVDLEGYLRRTLEEMGVRQKNIFSTGLCTFEESGEQGFFSRRRGDEQKFMTVTALLG